MKTMRNSRNDWWCHQYSWASMGEVHYATEAVPMTNGCLHKFTQKEKVLLLQEYLQTLLFHTSIPYFGGLYISSSPSLAAASEAMSKSLWSLVWFWAVQMFPDISSRKIEKNGQGTHRKNSMGYEWQRCDRLRSWSQCMLSRNIISLWQI